MDQAVDEVAREEAEESPMPDNMAVHMFYCI